MSRYDLTTSAQEDLNDIRDYYWREAGYRVVRQMTAEFVAAFRMIARNPGIGHTREDLVKDRAVLFWPMRDFLILYRTDRRRIEIVTIAHGSRDIARIIQSRDL
jgi:plasmid stabilization system protein ParE